MIARAEILDCMDRLSTMLKEADRLLHEPRNWRRIVKDRDLLANFRNFIRLRGEIEDIVEAVRAKII